MIGNGVSGLLSQDGLGGTPDFGSDDKCKGNKLIKKMDCSKSKFSNNIFYEAIISLIADLKIVSA